MRLEVSKRSDTEISLGRKALFGRDQMCCTSVTKRATWE